MIFVTVGTHEQQFNRLVEYVDRLKEEKIIDEEVIIQTGFSTYEPKKCNFKKLIPYNEMVENIKKARIVITHGGPASFILPLQYSKVPIVVPRKLDFEEHVNNHQVDFVQLVSERMNNIIPVYEIGDLKYKILNYDEEIKKINNELKSNNEKFNTELENIINELLK